MQNEEEKEKKSIYAKKEREREKKISIYAKQERERGKNQSTQTRIHAPTSQSVRVKWQPSTAAFYRYPRHHRRRHTATAPATASHDTHKSSWHAGGSAKTNPD